MHILPVSNDEFLIRTNEGFRGSPGMVRLIDDVLVQGETLEELYVNLRCCLECCRAMNITMGLEKLKVTGPGEKLSFAGYQISDAGFHPDFRKTAAIADFPRPTCQTDIKSWMGLCNQLGSFVFNLSKYTDGVRHLLQKNAAWNWTSTQETSFQETKKLLCSDVVRRPFNPNLPAENTHLITDASKKGLGCFLGQVCPETGNLYMVQCSSRSLTPAESGYSTIELEMLSLSFGCRRNAFYLMCLSGFTAVTDAAHCWELCVKSWRKLTTHVY